MNLTIEKIKEALSYVIEPDLKKDIIALDLVKDIKIDGQTISFTVYINNPAMHSRKRMQEACEHAIERNIGKGYTLNINIEALPPENKRSSELRTILPGVKYIVAVSSGKGGVGKSTVASNLAVALANIDFKVGLIDADIYGPSIPTMFDVENEKPNLIEVNGKTYIKPVESYGVKLLSIGFFADLSQAIAWRGPMATKALHQMFTESYWGELDFMIIDLPPGTGDIHLSIIQLVPLTGAIIVSTPQKVALADAQKGAAMFRLPSVNVPILGIVENMSWFTPAELPENKYYIFGKDGAKKLAEKLNVPLLAEIPLVQSICEAGDVGRPVVMQETTPQALSFRALARNLINIIVKKNLVKE
jgi:ATP-binding protein involved in chromosome partitioning